MPVPLYEYIRIKIFSHAREYIKSRVRWKKISILALFPKKVIVIKLT